MKKSTMTAIVNYLNDNLSYADEAEKEILESAIAELNAELNKGAEVKAQNAEIYEAAKAVVMGELSDKPVTCGELFEALEDKLPEGFTKGKLSYALTRLWGDSIVKVEGKVNGYRRA